MVGPTWTPVAYGQWRRRGGWLLQLGERLVEADAAAGVITVHARSNAPHLVRGTPLDGYMAIRTLQLPGLSAMDDGQVWAALEDAAYTHRTR